MRYEHGLSQGAIAEALGVSVATVSRHLQQAMNHGIVEVRVVDSVNRNTDLEKELCRRGLMDAVVVVEQATEWETKRLLGRAVARWLAQRIGQGAVIGVSNGESVAAVAAAMQRVKANDLEVVTLIGGVGRAEEPTHTAQVCRTMAEALAGRSRILPLPAVVETGAVAATLRGTEAYRAVGALYETMSLAIVGIGALSADSSTVRDGLLTQEELGRISDGHAAGSICARFFDESGRPLASDLDERTLSIPLRTLARVPVRVAVARGDGKVAAIGAAIRGQLINVLATDATTALALLR
ncbi:MAG: sugar-binding transcriptional regulator [Pararhizobium sp.]